MSLLMCFDYDQQNIIFIISFVITIHELVAKLIIHRRIFIQLLHFINNDWDYPSTMYPQ